MDESSNVVPLRLELSEAHAKWLEEKRALPCELAAEMGIVSKGVNLAFEYRRQGKLLWRQIRIEEPDGKRFLTLAPDGRTLKEAGIPLSFWNEDELLDASQPQTPRIITEGQFDAVSFRLVGATHVGSVPNGACEWFGEQKVILPEEDHKFAYLWQKVGERWQPKGGLATCDKIILATDGDKAGLVLREELAVRLGYERCWKVNYPDGCKDANEVLVRYGEDGVLDLISNATPIVPSRLVAPGKIPPREDVRYSAGWGFVFDRRFKICPPQLIVVTGKANDGKSQWALALGANLARDHGLKGAILQFEDNPERNRIDLMRYATEAVGAETAEAWVDRMFVTIAPNEDLSPAADYTLDWLDYTVREAAKRHSCKWIIIDPWNEIEHLWGRHETEANYLNRALKHIKTLARIYKLAIIVVAHPTKEAARHATVDEASLYDINGGAVWRNKADLGVIVWRDKDAPATEAALRKIKIDKSKDFSRMGVPGVVTMAFESGTATYRIVP